MNLLPLYDAFKSIASYLKTDDVVNLGVDTNTTNTSKDVQKNIDLLANKLIKEAAQSIPEVIGIVSEEDNDLILFRPEMKKGLVVIFDPLDGSKNVISNLTVGTIYGVYEYDCEADKILSIYETGYALYGPSTILVRTVENTRVEQLCLNQANEFVHKRNLALNKNHSILSINMAYNMESDIQTLIRHIVSQGATQRWCGAMVADVHQVLMRGGTFIYPRTEKNPNGKIRTLYEAIPMSHIFSILRGAALDINLSNIMNQLEHVSLKKQIHSSVHIILTTCYDREEIKDIMDINDLIKC